jgi:hypothetical protein
LFAGTDAGRGINQSLFINVFVCHTGLDPVSRRF